VPTIRPWVSNDLRDSDDEEDERDQWDDRGEEGKDEPEVGTAERRAEVVEVGGVVHGGAPPAETNESDDADDKRHRPPEVSA